MLPDADAGVKTADACGRHAPLDPLTWGTSVPGPPVPSRIE
jgi:hypothetical protein